MTEPKFEHVFVLMDLGPTSNKRQRLGIFPISRLDVQVMLACGRLPIPRTAKIVEPGMTCAEIVMSARELSDLIRSRELEAALLPTTPTPDFLREGHALFLSSARVLQQRFKIKWTTTSRVTLPDGDVYWEMDATKVNTLALGELECLAIELGAENAHTRTLKEYEQAVRNVCGTFSLDAPRKGAAAVLTVVIELTKVLMEYSERLLKS